MFTIAKRFEFAASHVLEGLPEGHKCGRLHGHNYVVELELAAIELDRYGFVTDYGDLAPFKEWLTVCVDHRHLNDVVTGNPTAELLAAWMYGNATNMLGDKVKAARVYETPATMAEYRPPTLGSIL